VRIFALGWLVGLCLLQQQATLPTYLGYALLFAFLVLSCFALRWFQRARIALIFLIAVTAAFMWAAGCAEWRLQQALSPSLEGKELLLTGVVTGLPDLASYGVRFQFQVEQATLLDGKPVRIPERIMLYLYQSRSEHLTVVRAGERWQFRTRLKRPHGNANPYGFDVEAWWLSTNIRATGSVQAKQQRKLQDLVMQPSALIARLRGLLRERIQNQLVNKDYAGVIVALVMGDQRAIEQSDWEIFNRTGIGHLVSISGLHITMVAALFAGLMQWLWRHSFFTRASLPLFIPAQKIAAATGFFAALIYVALAGFGIPAMRTLMMIAVVCIALWSGRMIVVSQSLAYALIVVTLFDPWAVLWPGFWLSFTAIACILYATVGRMHQLVENKPSHTQLLNPQAHKTKLISDWLSTLRDTLRPAITTQAAVTLGLLPLTMLLFAQVSLISPLANAFAIPLVSLVITPLSLIGVVLPTPLSTWCLGLAHQLMAWLVMVLTYFSNMDFAVWRGAQPDALSVVLAVIGTLWLLAPRGWPLRWCGLLTWLPIFLQVPATPSRGFWMTAFDVGQGNAVLIETATHRLLYDTGPQLGTQSDSGQRVLLPYFIKRGITSLDGLVISHSDMDHAGGALSLLKVIRFGWVSSSLPIENPILQQASQHHACAQGQSWDWDGVHFEMLQPRADSYAKTSLKPNARSCTLRISWGDKAVLLTGDIEAAQEYAMLERVPDRLQAQVLLAPHHGSGTSSTAAFLEAVAPEIAIFQVGYRNRYHHPKPEVFERYRQLGIQRHRTDESGAIRVEIDNAIKVSSYRSEHARYWYGR
jgi:competence protein ComEC